MEKAAILHYMEQNFCFVNETGDYVFRIRTKQDDLDKVIFHCRDKSSTVFEINEQKSIEMEKVASDGIVDYYEVTMPLKVTCLRYFFELIDKFGQKLFYGKYEFYEKKPVNISQMFDCPVKSKEEDRFLVPLWAKGKTIYQIFPDRFASDKTVDEKLWYEAPVKDFRSKYGGNLRGIIEKLDYIKDLGADILYLTPIFLANSNHKYDTIDYFAVDSEFGTKEDLKELVDKAHRLNMYVILDGVFNHTSTNFFAFEDLKKNGESSLYKDWYYPLSFPLKSPFGKKPNYLCFGYYGGMPKLNTSNVEVQEYIFKVVSYWILECGIDGWRLDVGDEISHNFWKKFRQRVKAVKEDALIVGENWFYAPSYLQGDEWDSLMNYHFRDAMLGFIAEGTLSASQFANKLECMRGSLHSEAYDVLWNLIDCHDTPRFLKLVKNCKSKQRLAVSIQLLSHGCPMIYYGDEVGMTGGNDPDCRRGMLWKEEKQDLKLLSYYKKLLALRKSEPCITKGKQSFLRADDENQIVIEKRTLNDREIVILYHNGKQKVELKDYAGKYNLLKEEVFDGKIDKYETVVLLMEGDRGGN